MLPLVSHGKYADGTDRQTDRSQTFTLSFPLATASVINDVDQCAVSADKKLSLFVVGKVHC